MVGRRHRNRDGLIRQADVLLVELAPPSFGEGLVALDVVDPSGVEVVLETLKAGFGLELLLPSSLVGLHPGRLGGAPLSELLELGCQEWTLHPLHHNCSRVEEEEQHPDEHGLEVDGPGSLFEPVECLEIVEEPGLPGPSFGV